MREVVDVVQSRLYFLYHFCVTKDKSTAVSLSLFSQDGAAMRMNWAGVCERAEQGIWPV